MSIQQVAADTQLIHSILEEPIVRARMSIARAHAPFGVCAERSSGRLIRAANSPAPAWGEPTAQVATSPAYGIIEMVLRDKNPRDYTRGKNPNPQEMRAARSPSGGGGNYTMIEVMEGHRPVYLVNPQHFPQPTTTLRLQEGRGGARGSECLRPRPSLLRGPGPLGPHACGAVSRHLLCLSISGVHAPAGDVSL